MIAQIQSLSLELASRRTDLEDDLQARLVQRAQIGDRGAFERLVERHERRVANTAWRLLGHREDTQDAAQEVFLRLFRHLDKVDPGRDLAPWLYRVTVNVCRDIGRQRGRQAAESLAEVSSVERSHWVDPAPDPAAQAATGETQRMVAAGLATLSYKERSALVLRDLEGLPTRRVAAILGSSQTTVRSQICRARLKLKKFRERQLSRRAP